jgi:hypothetical protein
LNAGFIKPDELPDCSTRRRRGDEALEAARGLRPGRIAVRVQYGLREAREELKAGRGGIASGPTMQFASVLV